MRLSRDAPGRGVKVFIVGAGAAAHLAGVVAAHSTLPVIGVPVASSPLGGFDSLLSTVQMPAGIPVATVGVGTMGAKNAAHLAAAILALEDTTLRRKVETLREQMEREVLEKSKALPRRLREVLGGEK